MCAIKESASIAEWASELERAVPLALIPAFDSDDNRAARKKLAEVVLYLVNAAASMRRSENT
jgi:hypothetical protein